MKYYIINGEEPLYSNTDNNKILEFSTLSSAKRFIYDLMAFYNLDEEDLEDIYIADFKVWCEKGKIDATNLTLAFDEQGEVKLVPYNNLNWS